MLRIFAITLLLALLITPATFADELSTALSLGDKHLAAGEFDQAETCFQHAIKLAPANKQAWKGYRKAITKTIPKKSVVIPKLQQPKPIAVKPSHKKGSRIANLLSRMRIRKQAKKPTISAAKVESYDIPKATDQDALSAQYRTPEIKTPPKQARGAFEPIDVEKLLAEAAKSSKKLGLSLGTTRIRRPWKKFSIRTELLTNPKLARRALKQLKHMYAFGYRRKVRSAVSYRTTIWNSKLYNALASILGGENGWDKQRTDKYYTLLCKHIPDKYEFRVRITNHRAPRLILDTADIHLRTFLTDDRDHRWNPVKSEPMGKDKLTSSGEYTVWFDRYDEKGRDIATVGHGRMYLNIEGIEDGKNDVRIPFKALILRR